MGSFGLESYEEAYEPLYLPAYVQFEEVDYEEQLQFWMHPSII